MPPSKSAETFAGYHTFLLAILGRRMNLGKGVPNNRSEPFRAAAGLPADDYDSLLARLASLVAADASQMMNIGAL
ncbi:MAG: hypothetical protein WAV28_18255 [Sedimentisphaerales bacterium]